MPSPRYRGGRLPARAMDQSSYSDLSLRSFLANLAGRSTEPAGGAALALAGASAAALVSLCCHSGERSAPDADVARAFSACRVRTETILARAQAFIDDDVQAYRGVTESLRLPRDSAEDELRRRGALDGALLGAIDVPLAVAETALETINLALETAPRLSPPVMGDLFAAICLAEAAVAGSLHNARINVRAVADRSRAVAAESRIELLAGRAAALRERAAAVSALDPRRRPSVPRPPRRRPSRPPRRRSPDRPLLRAAALRRADPDATAALTHHRRRPARSAAAQRRAGRLPGRRAAPACATRVARGICAARS